MRRKKCWDDEGVAGTVGTIMLIMIFLTALGMFTNQFVPIWMKENETNHMNDVIEQMSTLKSGIDLQIMISNDDVATAPIYSPIKLHAEGVPVFASSTVGSLALLTESAFYASPAVNITFRYDVTNTSTYVLNQFNGGRVGGNLEFYGANRYYVEQSVIYENGAIILNQTAGEVILSGIPMRITNNAGKLMVLITLTSLNGVNQTVGGFGTKSVSSSVEYSTYQAMNNATGSSVWLNITTKYGTAWQKYFNDTRVSSGAGIPASDWVVTKQSKVVNGITWYTVGVQIKHVNVLEYTKAVVDMSIADIGV